MPKKIILILGLIGIIILGLFVLNPNKQKGNLTNPFTNQPAVKKISPSETLTTYADPSGFTLSYPDNLSITKQDITNNSTYADIQLSSKDVNGSLTLKISDSKFKTIDEWVKSNNPTNQNTKEVKLGSLSGIEIRTQDRLLFGALDKGVLFNIEVPLTEENFWMKVYGKVLANFSFASPEAAQTSSDSSSSDISFEGEEVVQ